MAKYQVCVYAISKNEEQFVDRWMDSVSEADLVIVTDTGSKDGTVEKLRSRGALVYEETVSPWRFDAARNIALSHVPEDADICVSNDLDEVFVPGWRQKLEDIWRPEHTRAKYLFTWSYDAGGKPNKQYLMEKIHRRKDFQWVRPVHEVLAYAGSDPDRSEWVPGLVLNHYSDLSKPRSQYLPLLELSVEENPEDDRAMFWLGREYMYRGQYDEAIATLKRHLALSSAAWDEERSASMRLISRCLEEKKNLPEAKAWLYRAIAECPGVREPYFFMAKFGYREQNWPLVYAMAENALFIENRSGSYLTDPEAWGYAPYDYAALAAYHLGNHQKAKEYAKKAWELNPGEERLKNNLRIMEEALAKAGEKEKAHEQV